MAIPTSYKFPQTVDDRIIEGTMLKYDNVHLEEPIRNPISNKRILATLGIDEFIDRVIQAYSKSKTIDEVDEFNLYMKSRYHSLIKRKMIEGTIRKVNF